MGSGQSSHKSGGALEGAYALGIAPSGCDLPPLPNAKKTFKIKVPNDKTAGTEMTVLMGDKTMRITVPVGVKAGETFRYTTPAEIEKVYASTLQTIPGMTVLQSKPIVWGSVSYTFHSNATSRGQQRMGMAVADLMQQAQSELLEQGVNSGCNAVLGISYNVTNDSSDTVKQVIVTACGTPCLVVRSANETPLIITDVIVEPLYSVATNSAPLEEQV